MAITESVILILCREICISSIAIQQWPGILISHSLYAKKYHMSYLFRKFVSLNELVFVLNYIDNFTDQHAMLKAKNVDHAVIDKFRLETCSKNIEFQKIINTSIPEGSVSNISDGCITISNFAPNSSIEILCKVSGSIIDMLPIKLIQYLYEPSSTGMKSIIDLELKIPKPWNAELVELCRNHKLKHLTFRPSWSIVRDFTTISFLDVRRGTSPIRKIVFIIFSIIAFLNYFRR